MWTHLWTCQTKSKNYLKLLLSDIYLTWRRQITCGRLFVTQNLEGRCWKTLEKAGAFKKYMQGYLLFKFVYTVFCTMKVENIK